MPSATPFSTASTGQETASRQQSLQIITIYNLYRLVLALILLISYFYRSQSSSLGSFNPDLFVKLLTGYGLFNLATLVIPKKLIETLNTQVYVAGVILIDIMLLEMFCYASGGYGSGITPLLLVPVASGSLFFGPKFSTFFAAVASIALIYGEFYHSITTPKDEQYFVQAGLLGFLLFLTALGIQAISARIREKDLINRRQALNIEALQQINEQIIRRMQTGVVVLDSHEQVVHCNEAARSLLELPETTVSVELTLPQLLREQLKAWLQQPENTQVKFRPSKNAREILANFAYLQTGNNANILVFLDDYSEVARRAQHLKLMSLGRLTASIAHEIRNPLWAITHAAQLLGESPQLRKEEQKLLGIITNHGQRVNSIIQNVLDLSRYKPTESERIDLTSWLEGFVDRLKTSYRQPIQCRLIKPSVPVWIRFNPSQLEQVLINLCDNGLRHSRKLTGEEVVTLQVSTQDPLQAPVLEVIDEGSGIAESEIEQIFEPFYTTESGGTGLGLFICRELCEANNARLLYQRSADGRSAFRLLFSQPERQLF